MTNLASLTHLALKSQWAKIIGPATGTEVSGYGRRFEMLAALRRSPRLAAMATRVFRYA